MEIRIINKDPLFDYKHACLVTKGKNIKSISRPETDNEFVEYWIKQIIAEHSTLRSIHFVITDEIPKSCIMQIIRATKGNPQPEVCSSRPDWTGEERSNNPYELKLFQVEYTPESFLAMCRQRLCLKTEYRTREVIDKWTDQMIVSDDPLIKAIGYCAVPQCVYRGNTCPELQPCGRFSTKTCEKIIKMFRANLED